MASNIWLGVLLIGLFAFWLGVRRPLRGTSKKSAFTMRVSSSGGRGNGWKQVS